MKTNIILYGLLVVTLIALIFVKHSEVKYETYEVNGGRDTMVRLPSGMGVNKDTTKETAESLINNPRAGIEWQEGKEMLEYITRRDSGR